MWRCAVCGFHHNADDATRCVGCDSDKGKLPANGAAAAAAAAAAVGAAASPSPEVDVVYLAFAEAFALWCDDRRQNADYFRQDAMARAWDLMLDDESPPSQQQRAGEQQQQEPATHPPPGRRKADLKQAYQLIDSLALHAEYNKLLDATDAEALAPGQPAAPESAVPVEQLDDSAPAPGAAVDVAPAAAPASAAASNVSAAVAPSTLHPCLQAVASKLSGEELAQIQNVIDSALARINFLSRRLVLGAGFQEGAAAAVPVSRTLSATGETEPGLPTGALASPGAAVSAGATDAIPGAEGVPYNARLEWSEEDEAAVVEAERRLAEQDAIAKKRALEAANAKADGAAAKADPAAAASASAAAFSPAASAPLPSPPAAAFIPHLSPPPSDAVTLALLDGLSVLGAAVQPDQGATLQQLHADLEVQAQRQRIGKLSPSTDGHPQADPARALASLAGGAGSLAKAWTRLLNDGYTFTLIDDEHCLPTEARNCDPMEARARTLRAVVLLVLRRVAPGRVLSLSAVAAAVRTEAPALAAPHIAAAARSLAPQLGPVGASAGSGGVWGCGCTSHGANGICAHGFVRSAPPPPGDLFLEIEVTDTLAELEQLRLVQQPVVRNFCAAQLAASMP